ncbi:MAG TPA: glycosyltransferase family 39 protein [Candidatus Acidoferrum sp.]|nr:glycosyltransferase family 39 protein [Candidatus Acidoferrum sp.]
MSEQMTLPPSAKPLRSWELVFAAVTLLLVGVVAFACSRFQAITTDEVVHIPAGVSYLEVHDARMNPEHPPLLKILAAAPLVIGGLRLDYSLPHWIHTKDALFGAEAFSEIGPHSARWISAARVPMVGILLALGAATFWMARQLAGPAGGVLSLLAFAATPFFYAYGPLVHTDIGIALFALLATWTFVSLWNAPTWPRTLIFAVCFSGALLTKFTSGLLLPTFLLTATWLSLRSAPPRKLWRRAGLFLAAVCIAALIVYALYFFLFWDNDTAGVLEYRFEHSVAPIPAMQHLAQFLSVHRSVQHVLSPPIIYFLGVGHTLHALPRTTYLLGKTYQHGTPLYFPVLFFYKMPLGYLFLAGLLIVLFLASLMTGRQKREQPAGNAPDRLRSLLVLFGVFTLVSILSPLNIGIRHFSVPIATLTILLAMLVPLSARLSPSAAKVCAAAVALALLTSSIATARAYPNFIPYFNSFLGNEPKFDVAIDSNLDWGQGLASMEQFRSRHPNDSFAFDIEGSVGAVYFPGVPAFDCESGIPPGVDWAAIGASRFVNQPQPGSSPLPPAPQCRDFFAFPYQTIAGGSVYVFHLSQQARK